MKTLRKFFATPVTAILHLAGFCTSVASVYGSYQYALVEFDSQFMAASFAIGLLVAIFVGWEIALNAADKKRMFGALVIAAVAAGFSGQTVLDNLTRIERVELQTKADAQAQDDQAKATAAAAKADAAQAKAISTNDAQLATLRTANDQLAAQNQADSAALAEPSKNSRLNMCFKVLSQQQ